MPRTPLTRVARRLRAVASPDPATDEQLLSRYLTGRDQEAFTELTRRHARAVLAACRQVLSDPADVEDAFQATFLVLVQKAGRVNWRASLGGWLFAVAHRVAVRAARTRGRKSRAEQKAARPPSAAAPTPDLSWREAAAVLHEELDRLPDRYRLPLILCYLDGLSRDEAADRLGWKPGSVKAGLERGRERLRARLERRGVTLTAGLLVAVAGLAAPAAAATPDLVAAAVRAAEGTASAPILELARTPMTGFGTKAKFLLGAAVAAGVCVGLLASVPTGPRSEPPREKPTAAVKLADPRPSDPNPLALTPDRIGDGEPAVITGTVLRPDGQPAAGALITWRQQPFRDEPQAIYPEAVTTKAGPDGRFRLDVTVRGRTPFRPFWPLAHLTAQAPGFGPAAIHVAGQPDDPKELVLKLAADDVPIEGRIVDLEGKPIPGVTVWPVFVRMNVGCDLGPWLALANGTDMPPQNAYLGISAPAELLGLTQSATTNAAGGFKLTGLGRERVVGLRIEGAAVETHFVWAMTRAGQKVRVTNQNCWHPAYGPNEIYPAKFDHAAAPGGVLEGVITAADTGKPIAGARVTSAAWTGGTLAPKIRITATTDEQGHYKIAGYPRQTPYWIRFEPPAGEPYVGIMQLPKTEPDGMLAKLDAALPRGVVLKGTVTDRVSGRPVMAVVEYFPLASTPKLGPGQYPVPAQAVSSRADGSFSFVALPGRGLVAAKIEDPRRGAYLPGVGATDVDGFDKEKNQFAVPSRAFSLDTYDAYVGVNPAPGGDPVTVSVKLDPGKVVTLQLRDPDGKPLTGCNATSSGLATLDVRDLESDRLTIYAVDAAHPKVVFVRHDARKLVAAVPLVGAESPEVKVTLRTGAVITGRLIDQDGAPVGDTWVQGNVEGGQAGLTRSTGAGFGGRTDKDGRFRIEGVVPDLRVGGGLTLRRPMGYATVPVFANLTLKPGEVKDLGDVRVRLTEP
jgi:RNA polymerase sigma factor (sigma-70 family)